MTTWEYASNYRVWHVANPPGSAVHRYVSGPEEAATLIEKWAEADLQSSSVWANAFGLEVYEDGEWQEWCSLDGLDIDEFIGELNAQ